MTAIHPPHDTAVPRGALIGAAVLVIGVIAGTATMRIAQVPPAASPQLVRADEHVTPVNTRLLRFTDQANGGVLIVDVKTGAVVETIAPGGQTGFIRGVMRGLARERRMHGVGDGPPFALTLWKDGELSLVDTATNREIELGAFGNTNREAFATLLTNRETAK
jgi:putative photosynthetic complex assembly protein